MSTNQEVETVGWNAVAGWVIVLTILLFIALTACGGWALVWSFLSSATAASWVQAVGSIAAVCGAIWIMDSQHRRELVRARERERHHQRETLKALLTLFTYAGRACGYARKIPPAASIWPMHAEVIRACRSRLLSIPALEIPWVSLQLAVLDVSDQLLLCAEAARHAETPDAEAANIDSLFGTAQARCLAGASQVHEQLHPISTPEELASKEWEFHAIKDRFDWLAKKNAELLRAEKSAT